ncbi:hypothetical protein A8709_05665 [Paenibacillus pectinilyticus]|uniref:HTH luxR-type domain-containing protein n=1 Tax=Paenibacillus pectinilyticus TaxID=512399 RepID=A0A1C0ZSW0_9BACL|nr:LuxR C-terminal-related transcriptional regulator [Paenibacillus pectinilyticus]OCT11169.1 hypothetical protein A8709_05665 [Paenibacillus pectinilyticus]
MSVFTEVNISQRTWIHYNDLTARAKSELQQLIDNYGGVNWATTLPSDSGVEGCISGIIKEYAKKEIQSVSTSIPFIHLFILTNTNGVVIHMEGAEPLLHALEQYKVVPGCSFDLHAAGINAISLAMHTGITSVVEGGNHSLEMFSDWTCICQPIRVNGEIIGYLDLSMKEGLEVSFACILLERLVNSLTRDPDEKKEILNKKFETYKLTSREKEVAYAWLHNQSALQISFNMGIAEGTVRNMLKKVYAKTHVGDKGQYFRKFLL